MIVAIKVTNEVTGVGHGLSIYTGISKDRLEIGGIVWCNRSSSIVIRQLLDPGGDGTEDEVPES